ncbi:pilin [Candidatus Saccharibacteria bacterium]|nr:pilin [Candidatus Saccharibacteria bacterium]
MIKKFIISLSIVAFSATGLMIAMPTAVSAVARNAPCTGEVIPGAADSDANFFGFPTWYRGLGNVPGKGGKDGNCELQVNVIIFTVVLNIVDIALRIVGILAVGYVIYGGFRYVTSQGEPEETKKAQDTILKAVIGAVIAMISAIIVSFIVGRLGA